MEIKTAKKINEKSAYTGGVVNIGDLKKCKKNIYIKVDEEESIILQYWLFFHGWRTTKRKFRNHKLIKITKTKEFEAICNSVVLIRPDGTFYASGGYSSSDNIFICYKDMIKILDEGYCYIL